MKKIKTILRLIYHGTLTGNSFQLIYHGTLTGGGYINWKISKIEKKVENRLQETGKLLPNLTN